MRRHLVGSVLSELTERAFQFGSVIYLARVLQTAGFGVLSTAHSIASAAFPLMDLGLATYGTREVARGEQDRGALFADLVILRALAGGLLVGAAALSPLLPGALMGRRDVLIASMASLFAMGVSSDWFFRGRERFGTVAAAQTFGLVLSGALLYFGVRGEGDLMAGAWARGLFFGGAALALAGVLFGPLGLRPRRPRWRRARAHLSESLPLLGLFTLQLGITYFPLLWLGFSMEAEAVGLFAAPYRVTLSIAGLAMVLIRPFFSRFSKLRGDSADFERLHTAYKEVLFLAGLGVAVGGALLADELIALLFGAGYQGSAPLFRVLVAAAALAYLRASFGSVLIALGEQRAVLRASLISYPAGAAIAALLIETQGLAGAAYGVLCVETLVVLTLGLAFAKAVRPTLPFSREAWKPLAAAGLMAGALFALADLPVLARIALGGAVYLLAALALGYSGVRALLPQRLAGGRP